MTDPLLLRLTQTCAALPEAAWEEQGDHARFVIAKKTFAYYLNNHHGDGIVSVCCKVMPGDNTLLAAANPRRFYLPAYLASRGWVALRLDAGQVDWEEVAELLTGSYNLICPKRRARR